MGEIILVLIFIGLVATYVQGIDRLLRKFAPCFIRHNWDKFHSGKTYNQFRCGKCSKDKFYATGDGQ